MYILTFHMLQETQVEYHEYAHCVVQRSWDLKTNSANHVADSNRPANGMNEESVYLRTTLRVNVK